MMSHYTLHLCFLLLSPFLHHRFATGFQQLPLRVSCPWKHHGQHDLATPARKSPFRTAVSLHSLPESTTPTSSSTTIPSNNNSTAHSSQQQESLSAELDSILTRILDIDNTASTSLRPLTSFLQRETSTLLPLSRSQFISVFDAIEVVTAAAGENYVNSGAAASTGGEPYSRARRDMTDLYRVLQHRGDLRFFGIVNATTCAVPAVGPRNGVTPPLLETILGVPQAALTPKGTTTSNRSNDDRGNVLWAGMAVAALQALVSWWADVPPAVGGVMTCGLWATDRIFLNGAVLASAVQALSPGTTTKIRHHEAGHFLLAYLTGCPVEGCVLSAWAALRDPRFAQQPGMNAGTSFFDPELSQQVNAGDRQVTSSALDRYSMIVMAGIAAEAETYGAAEGGASDEQALITLLSQCGLSPERIKTQARWGAVQAVLLLRQYRAAYSALVTALDGTTSYSLGECIYALEEAGRNQGLSSVVEPVGYIRESSLGLAEWIKAADMSGARASEPPVANIIEVERDVALEMVREKRRSVEVSLKDVERRLSEME